MKHTKADRQRWIDEYLAATGENLFQPGRFIEWLRDAPEHEAYGLFYGQTDEDAARAHRVDMARRMAAGLRIVAQVSVAPDKGQVVAVTMREYPAYLSPVDARSNGGGYQRFDPNDPASMAELRRQGATALRSWLDRYAGAFEDADLSALHQIAAESGRVAQSA